MNSRSSREKTQGQEDPLTEVFRYVSSFQFPQARLKPVLLRGWRRPERRRGWRSIPGPVLECLARRRSGRTSWYKASKTGPGQTHRIRHQADHSRGGVGCHLWTIDKRGVPRIWTRTWRMTRSKVRKPRAYWVRGPEKWPVWVRSVSTFFGHPGLPGVTASRFPSFVDGDSHSAHRRNCSSVVLAED